jgi:monofunctional biosynthetic peptidoglycan transglycosylase
MTEYQAAQLMGVLPMPEPVRRDRPMGIYLGDGVDPIVWEYVNGAANVHVPRQIEGMRGWKAAVATVGITDTAADREADRGDEDARSTVPKIVMDRLLLKSIQAEIAGRKQKKAA